MCVEERCRGLTSGTATAFAWRRRWKLLKAVIVVCLTAGIWSRMAYAKHEW